MTLPPIPDAAWDALNDYLMDRPGDWHGSLEDAAWPHLYAAALRHAADHIQPLGAGLTNTELAIADRIRRMARDAVSNQPED